MTIELVSFTDLKKLMDLTKDTIGDYPALEVLRDSVVAAFEEETGRLFENIERSTTIYIGNSPTAMIALPGLPVSEVSSLVVTISETSETYTEFDDFEITRYGVRLLASVRNSKIAITYTGGLPDTIPTGIARAALLQTVYEDQAKTQIGAESVTTEGGTVDRPALGLLKEVRRLLKSHKHPLKMN